MNKKVLVTGGSKGIGKSIAKLLSEYGYDVYICARNIEHLEQTARQIKVKNYFSCDLTNPKSCQELIEKIGNVDILINNAGEYIWNPIEQTTEDQLCNLVEINIKAPYRLIALCISSMKQKKWGRIVNIGSISGVVGEANASVYSMTKSALNGLTKSLGLELAEYGITVNTINPGWVNTELAQNAVEDCDFSNQEVIDMIPQKRFISPDEIAHLVKYIISEEAKGLTAQNISLCAGLSAG